MRSQVPACLIAMAAASCQAEALFPLWPHAGDPAKLVLLRGIRHGRGALRLLPGLVLHQPAAGLPKRPMRSCGAAAG